MEKKNACMCYVIKINFMVDKTRSKGSISLPVSEAKDK